MKIVIDIPEHIYEHAKEQSEDSNDEWDAMRAIANGTLLPEYINRRDYMELRYKSEILEDQLYKEFYQDTKEHWSQREQPGIRDFIKWAIIKGYLKDKDDTTITVHDYSVTPITPIRDIMVNGKIGDVPNNPYEIKC